MLIRYQDLVTLDLVATEGSRHRVEDVFVDDRELRIAYVVADTGGWFTGRKAMVSIDRFGEPDVAATGWPCSLDAAALEDRPQPETLTARDERTLPEAMLAPAGSLISPRLIHGAVGEDHLPIPAKADPKGRLAEGAFLRSVGEWILDTEVLAQDEPAGRLMGFIFEAGDWRARYIVVETGGDGLPQNQRVLEASSIADADFEGRTVTLNVPADEVRKALDLHEVDGIEGKWYNKVLAYYGLQS